MCGIVGFISGAGKSGWPSDRTKFIRQGLVVDSLRGMDSTGIFSVRKGEEQSTAGYLKQAVTGAQFVCTKKFNEAVAKPDEFRALIGHNRAATQGTVTTANAHPFQEEKITLVHNGTLTSTYYMPKPERELKKKKVEVDSHVICHNLAHHPLAEWYGDMHGSWALVWHDAEDGSINVVRNESRPLHIAKVRGEETLIICSEADMLTFLARRCTIRIEDLFSLQSHHHFKWLPDTPVMEPVVTELERKYGYSTYTGYPSKRYSQGDTETWWNNALNEGSRRSANNARPFDEQGDQVVLCGKKRDVPEIHQLDLLEMDLKVQDRLEFKPWARFFEARDGRNAVAGFLPEADLPAIVYGVPFGVAFGDLSTRRGWLVKPVGVFEPDYAADDPASEHLRGPYIVCRFVQSYISAYTKAEITPPYTSQRRRDIASALGPRGIRVTVDAFHNLVKDGCVKCKRNISWLDDEDIMWSDDDKPLCYVCTSEARKVS